VSFASFNLIIRVLFSVIRTYLYLLALSHIINFAWFIAYSCPNYRYINTSCLNLLAYLFTIEIQLAILVGSELPSPITVSTSDTVAALRTKICAQLGLQQRERWIILELVSGPRTLSLPKSLSEEYLKGDDILRVGFIAPG
jgi:hypothetical protein